MVCLILFFPPARACTWRLCRWCISWALFRRAEAGVERQYIIQMCLCGEFSCSGCRRRPPISLHSCRKDELLSEHIQNYNVRTKNRYLTHTPLNTTRIWVLRCSVVACLNQWQATFAVKVQMQWSFLSNSILRQLQRPFIFNLQDFSLSCSYFPIHKLVRVNALFENFVGCLFYVVAVFTDVIPQEVKQGSHRIL